MSSSSQQHTDTHAWLSLSNTAAATVNMTFGVICTKAMISMRKFKRWISYNYSGIKGCIHVILQHFKASKVDLSGGKLRILLWNIW